MAGVSRKHPMKQAAMARKACGFAVATLCAMLMGACTGGGPDASSIRCLSC